ncbi:MAG: hypothetical protein Q9200_006110 [Gallowayella weberi]
MPFLWVALFTWALTASHGFGPLLHAPSKPMNGMSAGYLFCYAITASSSGANYVAANSISFGNDLTTLFPRYINIRRGQYICALLGFVIFPWKIEKSASNFLAFLNGYSIFLAPLSAIILTDYYFVRYKSGYNVSQLYTPGGLYWYRHGVNWRAIASFFVGMLPLLPGLIYQINPNLAGIARGYINFSSLAWLESTLFACASYYLFCVVSPMPKRTDAEDKMNWAIQKRGSDPKEIQLE